MTDERQAVTLRSIAVAAFLPPGLFSIGTGAVTPIIPLTATSLGASTAIAAVVVALPWLGRMVADGPAGALTARYGERPAMIGAGWLCAAALAAAMFAPSLALFAVAIFVLGMGTAAWMLARQTFVVGLAPFALRARAMSTLAGAQRIGLFLGPFIGAGAVNLVGTRGSYGIGVIATLVATIVLMALTQMTKHERLARDTGEQRMRYWQMTLTERRTFLTVGFAVLLVSVIRGSRRVVLPLWGEHLGLTPETISLIYGLSGAVAVLLFYPAGRLMDLRGRAVAAVASMLALAAAHLVLPWTNSVLTLAVAALLMGLGNGLGSGLVMTIGADIAPPNQRPVFFGIWRMISDAGTGVGPFLLAGITAAATLAFGVLALGGVGLLAAAAMGYWVPRRAVPRDRTAG